MEIIDIENNIVLSECPCCGSTDVAKVGMINYARKTYYSSSRIRLSHKPELWQCNGCSSGFTQNRVSQEDSINLYRLGDGWVSEEFKDSKSKEAVNFIDSWIKESSKVLDVGCSNGAFLDHIKKGGAKTFGLEYSASNLEQLRSKNHTAYSDWNDVDELFDVITAFDLVEHLYDLEGFLNSCYKYLKEDGVIILMTGDICSSAAVKAKSSWWYVRHPEHIVFPSHNYFSKFGRFKLVDTLQVHPRNFNPKSHSGIKKLSKLSKAALKNIFLNSFCPLPFMQGDHSTIVLQKV